MREKPFKYLGWIIWPTTDETTGKPNGFDIHQPGNLMHPYDTFATIDEARTAIRREHRTANNPTLVGY